MNSPEPNLKESDANKNEIEAEDWKTVTKTSRTKAKSDQKQTSPNKPVEVSSNTKIDLDINKENVQKVKALVDRRVKSLIIVRGISGSGKSTLAR
jgi:excinuclease UvrABC ATPase subunit